MYFLFERKNGILTSNERTVTYLCRGSRQGKNPPEEKRKGVKYIEKTTDLSYDRYHQKGYGRLLWESEDENTELRSLAEEGIRYENAYTCQPVCGPARSAIFTGTFPHTNGMVTNSIAMGDNVKTIGQRLSDNGIRCGYIGKWHLDGSDYFGNGKCPEGWDPEYWYDMRTYLSELTDEEKLRSRIPETSFSEDFGQEFMYAHRCSDRALKYLDAHKDEDFFLCVSYDEPHEPSLCPEPFCHMYDGFKFDHNPNFQDDLSKKPFLQQLWANEKLHMSEEEINKPSQDLSLFLGCNSFADYEMGRVLDKIKEVAPDAMVIYTSDHGAMWGAHRLTSKNAAVYKEVANIPLIIKGGAKGCVQKRGLPDRYCTYRDGVFRTAYSEASGR